jgi:hypothetical protein
VTTSDIVDAVAGMHGFCQMSITKGDEKYYGYLEIAVTMREESYVVRFFELLDMGGGTWRIIGEGSDFTDAVTCVLALWERVQAASAADRLGHQP